MFGVFHFLKRAAKRASRNHKPQRQVAGRFPRHRTLVCEALEVRTLLSVSLAGTGAGYNFPASSEARPLALPSLPLAAQHAISSTIANDLSTYSVASGVAGADLANLANGFTAQVHAGALQVSAGTDTWDLSLMGVSYGPAAQAPGTAQTSVNGNRVDANFGTIDEWFVNSPAGLEQGFNVAPLPQSELTGSLTVELALGGDLKAAVNAAGDGLALARLDGSAALVYSGLTAYDATGKNLPVSMSVQTTGGQQELLIQVNDAGATGQITIDPFVQEAKLTASDGTSSANFGYSVAVSGNMVVVGVPNANAAYVFTEPGTGWANMTETAKLTASDGAAQNEFGYSVAINGNSVVVSAPNAKGSITGRPGAVYLFTEPASGWASMTQTAKLTPSDGATGPWFGQAVAISGNTVVVGATGTAANGYSNTGTGAAYVFTEPASGWANMSQTATLTASDGVASDNFGCSVAIDGGTLVVGAQEAKIGANSGQGAAYVFTVPGGGWTSSTETAKLTASDGVANNLFGASVSISGNAVAVGAWGANNSQGAAYLFAEPSNGWASMTQTARLAASDGAASDNFGFSVSLSGNIVVIAAPDAKIAGNSKQGAAYLFTETGSVWAQTTKLTASDGAAGDLFGSSVSISGNTVVIGADNANGGQGAAYVEQQQTTNITVQGVTPSAGPLASGTAVTITGTGFTTATLVDFGTTAATSFTVNSPTQITAISPAETAGTVDVTVTSPAGTSATSATDRFTFVAAPTVTAVSPAAGPLSGGTSVTITGTNFTGATLVDFGTVPAVKVVVVSATQITANSPAEAAGTVDVTVTSPGGTSASSAADHFAYTVAPVVTGVSPAAGPLAGGTSVTITGTGLSGATLVDFGSVAATKVVVVSPTQITATSPAEAAGTVDVTVTTAGGVSATSTADQFAYLIAPTVTAVSPIVGPLSGGTLVTITGTNFTGATLVDFGTIAATNVIVVSPTQITAISPAEAAGMVDVTVTGPGGVSTTSAADQFTYTAAPTVTAVSPTSGPLAGGTSVTITGTGLTGATVVDFGSVAATNVVVVSDTQITATSPAGAAGTVNVTVTTPGGVSASSPADHFAYVLAPVVLSVTASAGPSAGGVAVTITGTGFTGATAVNFGAFAGTNLVVVSATQITVTSPAEAAGKVDVIVAGPGGMSALSPADQYTFVAAPDVTGVTPAAGPLAGGMSVTITGVNFTGATAVNFGTVAATNIVVNSPTQITATNPAELAGLVDVTVVTVGGTSGTSPADQFTYMAVPTVTSLSPTAGPLAGGTAVTITGAGFTGATVVDFGTIPASHIIISSATQIIATSPAEAAGTVNVTVTSPGGTSTISPADQYTYAPAPTVTSITPAQGPAAGGTSVTIVGTGFSGAPVVDFGATAATNVVVVSPTQITATSPVGAVGTVNVTVTAPGGTSATSAADRYTYLAAPTVTAIGPVQGPVAGGTSVVITGTHFTGATLVDFGTLPATNVVVVSATQITATSPAELPGPVDVTVTAPGGVSATSPADQFTFVGAPAVTSLSPSAGPLAGGTSVTITGSGFTTATVVDFGTKAATNLKIVSSTQITVTSPAGTAGLVDVTVTGLGGVSATSPADQFTYVAAPTVTALSPSAGPLAGGTTVTITGTGFSGTPVVDFGTVAATGVVVVSPTQITAVSPAETAGIVNVTVTGPGGTSATSSADQFTYTAGPTVTSLSPIAGPLAGGTSVTISGAGFSAATVVNFGTLAGTNMIVNSPTQITVTSPAEAAGRVDVTVTTPGGVSATSPADQFTYLAAPTVTGISPAQGPAAGGTTVTITGTGFSGSLSVNFGTITASNVSIVSPTQITAISPPNSAGTVHVTVTGLGGTTATSSADQFTYLAAPSVTGVSPAVGPVTGGTQVTITGTGFTGATVVGFGSIAATNVVVVSATTITATSPAELPGPVDVTVVGPGGVSAATAADQFIYAVAPAVTGISPAAGPTAGGTQVTITGTGFTGATAVNFGTLAASSVVVVSATQIVATSPAGTAGTVDVTVTGPIGVSATSAADQFAYTPAPTVTGLSTASGPAAGGTSVTINGTGFTSASVVDFGTTAATNVVVVSPTQIVATSPAEAAGTVDVAVVTASGISATSVADQFNFAPAPSFTITGPTSGTFAAGQTVNFQWTAANVDAGSTISLAYDTTTSWGNPTLIESNGVSAANGAGSYTWNTTGVAPGTYYLEGYLNDAGIDYYSNLGTAITITAAANTTPVVTTNPSSQTVANGKSVSFQAAATGTPTPTVQWQVSTNKGPFTNIPGATSAVYTVTAATSLSGNQYQAVFTNAAGTATTKAATLVVTAAGLPKLPTIPAHVPRLPSIP
jgi:large repetitive protein